MVKSPDRLTNKKTFMDGLQQDKRLLTFDCGEEIKTVSENPNPAIVECTMGTINWKEFHVVQLKDQEYNALHLGGSLKEQKFGSGYVTHLNHRVKIEPPKSVEEMTQILIDFLENEDYWRQKYVYR